MTRRDYLGSFELMVLLAVMQLADDAYGVPIARTIEDTTGRLVALGSVYAALDRLQSDDLITLQRIEEFYVRVSGILRYYIEWRFGLRAPEQTTEEFLDAMLVAGGPIAEHRDLLSAFLAHCDLVKFARHQPAPDDMHNALQRARDFVEQTADPESLVSAGAAGTYAA